MVAHTGHRQKRLASSLQYCAHGHSSPWGKTDIIQKSVAQWALCYGSTCWMQPQQHWSGSNSAPNPLVCALVSVLEKPLRIFKPNTCDRIWWAVATQSGYKRLFATIENLRHMKNNLWCTVQPMYRRLLVAPYEMSDGISTGENSQLMGLSGKKEKRKTLQFGGDKEWTMATSPSSM